MWSGTGTVSGGRCQVAWGIAVDHVTTGNLKFAECFYVSRVYFLGHSANKFFAECYLKTLGKKKTLGKEGSLPSVKQKTLGK